MTCYHRMLKIWFWVALVAFIRADTDVEILTSESDGAMPGVWVTPPGFDSTKKSPAVILLADSNHIDELELTWAKNLSRNGWLVLATSPWTKQEVAEFKNGTSGSTILGRYTSNVSLSQARYRSIVKFLKEQPGVDTDKIVGAGFCFGGWGILELARMNLSGLLGLVSIHGAFRPGSATPEKINARVLILHGANDQSTNTVDNIGAELKKAGAVYETTTFGFVYHSYTDPTKGYAIGKSSYNPYASMRAYLSTENFFIDVLNPPIGSPYTYAVSAAQLDTLVEESVTYMDGETELKGYIYYKKSLVGSKAPGVVVSHAWGGLKLHERNVAQRLALNGYVGFAHSVYTPDESAGALNMMSMSALVGKYSSNMELYKGRMSSAIKFLGSHSMVNGKKIAVSGYCFGGGSALVALNLNLPEVLGVAAFHGSLNARIDEMKAPLSARVLIMHGADDPNIDDTPRGNNSMVQSALEAKLNEKGANWELTKYSGTGHGFTELGTAGYNAISDRRSFTSFLDFLVKLFADRVCFNQPKVCSSELSPNMLEQGRTCSCDSACVNSGSCCKNYFEDCFYYNQASSTATTPAKPTANPAPTSAPAPIPASGPTAVSAPTASFGNYSSTLPCATSPVYLSMFLFLLTVLQLV